MRKLIIVLVSFFLMTYMSIAQNESTVKHYFAISLQQSPDDLITFAIISVTEKGKESITYYKRHNFIRMMIGFEYSIANPLETNVLKDAGIDGPEVFGNLWKLRYSESPYKSDNSEPGWAKFPYRPSEGQLAMLSAFGIKTLNDFAYGDNLIALFKAMNDPNWVGEYTGK